MRKSNAIVKIVLWSILVILLTNSLISLTKTGDFFGSFLFNIGSNRNNSDPIRESEFDSDQIENINLSWIDGSVNITSYDGDKIIVTEKMSGNWKDEDFLKISSDNKTLNLNQPKRKIQIQIQILPFLSVTRTIEREIKLPNKLYNELTIKGTSGNLMISNVESNILDFKMTSGKAEFTQLKSEKLTTNITSGKFDANGAFNDINVNSTSGTVSIETDIAPSKMNIDMTSGTAKISIPENEGFQLSHSKTSGSFTNDFETDGNGIYKNGQYLYNMKMTSGQMKLLKK